MTQPLTTRELVDLLGELEPDDYPIELNADGVTWTPFTRGRVEAIVRITREVSGAVSRSLEEMDP